LRLNCQDQKELEFDNNKTFAVEGKSKLDSPQRSVAVAARI
jgi:hypothetical protein